MACNGMASTCTMTLLTKDTAKLMKKNHTTYILASK